MYTMYTMEMALQVSARLVFLLLLTVGAANCSKPRQIVRGLQNIYYSLSDLI